MKKKMTIPIIFLLVIITAMFSGCHEIETFPVHTEPGEINELYETIQLIGEVGVPFCKAKNHSFVYDTESHDNWEDYAFVVNTLANPYDFRFYYTFTFSEVAPQVTYYFRAVAYCYDFKTPYKHYKIGHYQGEEETFKRPF